MSSLTLRFLSGARSGDVVDLAGGRAILGRSPRATVRFGPDRDLEVSAEHAELVRRGDDWYVRDLGSRNGTWLDGTRVEGERRVRPGSRLRFGADGPEVEILPAGGPAGATPATTSGRVGRSRGLTPSDRIRALARRNRKLTRALVAGLMIAGGVGAGLWWAWASRDAAYEEERAALQADMDRLLQASRRTIEQLQGERDGLAQGLQESEAQVTGLRDALDSAEREGGDEEEVDDLRRQLQSATVALTRQQLAASLDFASIEDMNRSAVAMVYVELEPGQVATATAFAIRPDGFLLTNRHVVRGEDGDARPLRIAVQFTDSPQVWPGEVVRVSEDVDLALLRVEQILGDVPTVAGFNQRLDTLPAGAPVALVGFPLGGENPFEVSGRTIPRALTTAGVVSARLDGRMEILGYGEQGASGSPVLDGDGQVVGVLFGGRDGDAGRTLVAVPADEVLRFVDAGGG